MFSFAATRRRGRPSSSPGGRRTPWLRRGVVPPDARGGACLLRRYGVAVLGVLPDAVGGKRGVDEPSASFGVDLEGALLRRLAYLL